jgi:hypothetical protein
MNTRWVPLGLLVVIGSLLTTSPVGAIFIRPEIVEVPVERLVNNLEEAVKKDPKQSVPALYNLARLHAMAFALKTDTAKLVKGREDQGHFFGFTPAYVPFKNQKAEDPKKMAAAKAHLEKAIETYATILKLDPNHMPARLGHAWCIEQLGKKDEAIKQYRTLIETAWAVDKEKKTLGLGGHTITAEASGYLIDLLDKEKDKAEIATLQDRVAHLMKLPRPVTPIAIPLRAGLTLSEIEAPTARVPFDADGSGLKRTWSWINPQAGWLVHDPQGRGEITSAIQLFGNVTYWLFWDTGYDALAALDDNHDGLLSGSEMTGLAIWHDRNANGVSELGEVKPLSEHGIVALSCRHQRDGSHPDRIAYSPEGVTFRDGETRATYDIILKARK